jgi:hypothetical protein
VAFQNTIGSLARRSASIGSTRRLNSKRARLMRDFTVPSGKLNIEAISS